MAKYSDELKGVVRALYLRRYTPKEIASELNLPNARIVYYWAEKYKWADLLSFESTEEAIERRYQLLAGRDNKTDLDLKEMDLLIAHATKLRAQSNKHKEKLASSQGNGKQLREEIARTSHAANASTRKTIFHHSLRRILTPGRTNIFSNIRNTCAATSASWSGTS